MWAVEDRRGEVYAIEPDYADAEARARDASEFLRGALDCGHPRARPWVEARLPFIIVRVTPERAEEIRAEATPVLEREP